MPRKLNPLDGWLASAPGLITGSTEAEAIENTHARYQDDGGKLNIREFEIALRSAGRLPANCYRNHGTGEYVYRIALPERQPDAVRSRSESRMARPEGRRFKWTHAKS